MSALATWLPTIALVGMLFFSRKLMITIGNKNRKIEALETKIDVLSSRLLNGDKDNNGE